MAVIVGTIASKG